MLLDDTVLYSYISPNTLAVSMLMGATPYFDGFTWNTVMFSAYWDGIGEEALMASEKSKEKKPEKKKC